MATKREGSRWIGDKPSGKEVADWFLANAPMHEGMNAEDYVTGVVLIPAREKIKLLADGKLVEREQQTWTPYVKIETRIAYFWKWVALHPEWVGAIEPADVQRLELEGVFNAHLPAGFFRLPVQDSSGRFVHYVCCSMQVRIYTRDAEGLDHNIMEPAAGSKMVAMLNRFGVDDNALMKAESGAVGRALAMAGMLVIPGSGVASAEDMNEMLANEGRSASVSVDPTLPATPTTGSLVDEVQTLSVRLQSENPGAFEELELWAAEKGLDLNDLKEHQLRGVHRALLRKLDA